MRLSAIILDGFRSFKSATRVDFDDLTAIVGRNDVGKSSILEALDIFFEGGTCAIDVDDLCKDALGKDVSITCIFDELPSELVIDTATKTTLHEEQLLDSSGKLQIRKTWDCSKKPSKPSVFAVAVHAMTTDGSSPLQLTNTKLKAACKAAGIDLSGVNQSENPPLRHALRLSLGAPTGELAVDLDKEDGKRVWSSIEKVMPTFALFKADRESTDGDAEVQTPLKTAVKLAVSAASADLDKAVEHVKKLTKDVADRTLAKLHEMSPSLASELEAEFDTPKWDGVFKATFRTDKGVPLNKRGSGVRRLILLNFFRAEADRLASESGRPVIYAVEEPETSQHPDNQRMLIAALSELAEAPAAQVIITTHVPALAGLIATKNLRLVEAGSVGPTVSAGDDSIYAKIANTLGIIADKRLELLVCLEGPSDVDHIAAFGKLRREEDPSLPCLSSAPRIAVVPLGGSNLLQWASQHYLRKLGAKEFHLYDRWPELKPGVPRYQSACDDVNLRGTGYHARLTKKLEIENYLHPDAILAETGAQVAMTDNLDVEKAVEQSATRTCRQRDIKHALVAAANRMTLVELKACDPLGETADWMKTIKTMLATSP